MTFLHPLQILRGAGRAAILLMVALTLTACGREGGTQVSAAESGGETASVLQVLKDPSCGCCEGWVNHVSERGFMAQISHPQDLSGEKLRLGISPQYQSCHTAISEQGYVFEGHIPANIIQRFLDEQPEAIGLAVPGMPLGSPGMEIGDQFRPYDVLLLKTDGSAEVYAHIATAAEQY